MPSFKRPIGASGAALALALVAAACSSGSTDTTAAGIDDSTTSESVASPAEESDTSEAAETAPAEEPAEAEADSEDQAEVEGPAPEIEHSFPDLETVTISDGAPINLADELAGGDTPVLLWFFAPH